MTTQLTNAPSSGGPLGTEIMATASLSDGSSPGGEITFRLYGPGDAGLCSGAEVFADTAPVTGNGNYTSAGFTPTERGNYRWTASYSGDGYNDDSAAPCSDPVALADVTAPQTKITAKPKVSAKGTAKIRFSADDPNTSFQCKLDKAKWKACSSPISYRKLKPGKHVFQVRATDADANTDPTPAKANFKVRKPRR